MPQARILVVDGCDPLRDVTCEIVRKDPWLCVVGAARDTGEAEVMVSARNPDLVLINIALPDGAGFALTRRLAERYPTLPIILIGDEVDTDYAQVAYRAGASAYLSREEGAGEILKMIHGALTPPPNHARADQSDSLFAKLPSFAEVK